MDNKVANSEKRGYIILLTVLTLVSGFFTAIFFQSGIFLISITSGFLSCVFLLESTGKHRWTYVLPVLLVLFDLIFNGIFSFNCAFSVIVAFIIYRCFLKWRTKGESAVYASIAVTVAIYLSFLLVGFFLIKEFSFEGVMDFYKAEIEALRTEFITMFSTIGMDTPDGGFEYIFTAEDLELIFDGTIRSLPSFFGIMAFASSGIALKMFTVLGVKRSIFADRVEKYTFRCSNVFAYFYCALVIFSFFVSADGVFALTVSNLCALFVFVFAYLGYKYLSIILGKSTGKPRLSYLIVLCVTVVFSAFAVQLLSYIGVFATIVSNKTQFISNKDGGNK